MLHTKPSRTTEVVGRACLVLLDQQLHILPSLSGFDDDDNDDGNSEDDEICPPLKTHTCSLTPTTTTTTTTFATKYYDLALYT